MSEADRFWSTLRPQVGWLHVQLRRLGVWTADLDDVTQELLVQVYQRWKEYDEGRPLRTWLMAFALRVTANHRRLRKRHPERAATDETSGELLDPAPSAEERASDEQARALVLDALEALDEDRRAVFVMVELEEMPAPEVAAAVGVPVNTIYSRLRLARQDFAAAVRRVKLRRGLR